MAWGVRVTGSYCEGDEITPAIYLFPRGCSTLSALCREEIPLACCVASEVIVPLCLRLVGGWR